MLSLLESDERLASWLGETMSAPKYPEYLTTLSIDETEEMLESLTSGEKFIRPGDARLCYFALTDSMIRVFANGEYLDVDAELAGLVQAITDQVEFDFSGLDLEQHDALPALLRFLLQQQILVLLD